MTAPNRKMQTYLEEAYANERRFARTLEKRIETAPPGDYQRDLVRHLRETRDHARLLRLQLRRMGAGQVSLGRLAVGVVRTALDIAGAPFARTRAAAGADQVLGGAQRECAEESLQIAIYTAIEQLARRTGDEQTAELAVSIRAQEEEMLLRMSRHVAPLTDAVVASEVDVDANHESAIESVELFSSAEPWPGYDSLNIEEVRARLTAGDPKLARKVRVYERAHKARAGVLDLTERTVQHR